jgi:hypothetical protein
MSFKTLRNILETVVMITFIVGIFTTVLNLTFAVFRPPSGF